MGGITMIHQTEIGSVLPLPSEAEFLAQIVEEKFSFKMIGQIGYAFHFAAREHLGQKRLSTGQIYLVHPVKIASKAIDILENTKKIYTLHGVTLALLHDVPELYNFDRHLMRAKAIECEEYAQVYGLAEMLMSVSRLKGEDYGYSLANVLEGRWICSLVKLIDLVENSSDLIHTPNVDQRILKYRTHVLSPGGFVDQCEKKLPPNFRWVVPQVRQSIEFSLNVAIASQEVKTA